MQVHQYVDGKWADALAALEACATLRPWDGPTLKLMKYIEAHSFGKGFQRSAPAEWDGAINIDSPQQVSPVKTAIGPLPHHHSHHSVLAAGTRGKKR